MRSFIKIKKMRKKECVLEELIKEFEQEYKVALAIGNEDKIKTVKHLLNIAKSKLLK